MVRTTKSARENSKIPIAEVPKKQNAGKIAVSTTEQGLLQKSDLMQFCRTFIREYNKARSI